MADEAAEVNRILKAKSYFEILQLSLPDVTVEDVKKAHRRLVLQVHPDKCRVPEAAQAFDELTKAVALLADEEVLSGFREMWENKERRKAFEQDPAAAQAAQEDHKRRREAGEAVPGEPLAKMPKVPQATDLDVRLEAARKEKARREERLSEEQIKKEKAKIEEAMLRQTRGSWTDFQKKGTKSKMRMPGIKKETT
jgi:DnaJ family protein C protein 8